MRFLLLSSVFLLSACTVMHTRTEGISDCQGDVVFRWDTTMCYNMVLVVKGMELTGIALLQRRDDSSWRFIMSPYVGPTLMDLTLTKEGYTRNFVYKKLDRKAILRLFHEDITCLTGLYALKGQGHLLPGEPGCCYPVKKKSMVCYEMDGASGLPVRATLLKKGGKKTTIGYFHTGGNAPDSILIYHHNFDMQYKFLPLH